MTWMDEQIAKDDPGAQSVPSRVIATPVAPSATRHTFCQYTVEMVCDATEAVVMELRCDAANPPTVVRSQAQLSNGVANAQITTRQTLYCWCPPGHFVSVVKASGTGEGTLTAVQTEIAVT